MERFFQLSMGCGYVLKGARWKFVATIDWARSCGAPFTRRSFAVLVPRLSLHVATDVSRRTNCRLARRRAALTGNCPHGTPCVYMTYADEGMVGVGESRVPAWRRLLKFWKMDVGAL